MWRFIDTFGKSKLPRSCEDFKTLDSQNLKKVRVKFEKFDQSVNIPWDGQNVSVFHFVAAKLDLHQMRCVLPKVHDVNQKSSKNWNVLHFAVYYNNTAEVIKEFCNKGVDADLRENEDECNPIMFEINKLNSNFEVLKILWEYSDADSRRSSIDLAKATQKQKIVRYLEKQLKADESDDRWYNMTQIQEALQGTVHQHHEKLGAQQQKIGNHGKQLKKLNHIQSNQEIRLSEIEYHLESGPLVFRRAGSVRSSYHRMDTESYGRERNGTCVIYAL